MGLTTALDSIAQRLDALAARRELKWDALHDLGRDLDRVLADLASQPRFADEMEPALVRFQHTAALREEESRYDGLTDRPPPDPAWQKHVVEQDRSVVNNLRDILRWIRDELAKEEQLEPPREQRGG